jgi:hypothetical protein
VAEGAGLLIRCTARYRRFKSYHLREYVQERVMPGQCTK